MFSSTPEQCISYQSQVLCDRWRNDCEVKAHPTRLHRLSIAPLLPRNLVHYDSVERDEHVILRFGYHVSINLPDPHVHLARATSDDLHHDPRWFPQYSNPRTGVRSSAPPLAIHHGGSEPHSPGDHAADRTRSVATAGRIQPSERIRLTRRTLVKEARLALYRALNHV